MEKIGRRWTRVRTLGRGASGAEVFLAADDASGALFAVKSVPERGAAALAREGAVMSGLRSPHVVSCFGGRARRDGSYQLFLEFAPGGSLADAAARGGGGRLGERDVRRYAADVARGLACVHGAGLVHGDVKPRNVVVGADGLAKLADFGCARAAAASGAPPAGGTPAFMAPEVARGERQGPAADVWALGCTVIEMATGRAPWSHVRDVLAAVRVIGYTDAVPEIPPWLSAEAKDFISICLARRPSDRPTAAALLEHPFIASGSAASGCDATTPEIASSSKGRWVSPKSTLDDAFWESDTDDDEDYEVALGAAARIEELACSVSTVPADWDSDDEGWIDVISTPTETSSDAVPVPEEGKAAIDNAGVNNEEEEEESNNAEVEPPLDVDADMIESAAHNAGETDASPEHAGRPHLSSLARHAEAPCKLLRCNNRKPCNEFCSCPNLAQRMLPHFVRRRNSLTGYHEARISVTATWELRNATPGTANPSPRKAALISLPATLRADDASSADRYFALRFDTESAAPRQRGRSRKRLAGVNFYLGRAPAVKNLFSDSVNLPRGHHVLFI